mgnify:CR=1 FL=1
MDLETKDICQFVEDMVTPFTMTLYSKRRSGKSFLTKNIVYEISKQNKADVIFCLSNTAHLTDDYNFLQPRFIKKFSEKFIADVIAGQEKLPTKKRPHILIIIDDCVGNSTNKKESSVNSSIISEIFMTGRHYNISLIFLNQSVTNSTSTSQRNNSDYSLFSKLNKQQLENMYDALPLPINKNEFTSTIYKNTTDFKFVVFDHSSQSSNISEFMHSLKASPKNYFIKQ